MFTDREDKSSDAPETLHAACENGSVAVVRRLLEEKADPNILGVDSFTPLQLALLINDKNKQKERLEIVDLLLDHKADVNAGSEFDPPLLLLAEYEEHTTKPMERLLEHPSINTNVVTEAAKMSALHIAVGRDKFPQMSEKLVRTLLSSGKMNLESKNSNNLTPLGVAIEANFHPGIELLLEAKADPSNTNLGTQDAVIDFLRENPKDDEFELGTVAIDARDSAPADISNDKGIDASWPRKNRKKQANSMFTFSSKHLLDSKSYEPLMKLLHDNGLGPFEEHDLAIIKKNADEMLNTLNKSLEAKPSPAELKEQLLLYFRNKKIEKMTSVLLASFEKR